MDPEVLKTLLMHGPFALFSGIVGWAYWQKDKKLQEQTMQLMQMIQSQVASDVKLEQALLGLRDVILASKDRE